MTETYKDRFEWDFSSVLLAAVCGFVIYLVQQQKNMLVIISQHSRLSIKI